LINTLMWDEQRKFYFDLTLKGERAPVKTVAAYWTLLARVASPDQANALVAELRNPATFARMHRVPTLAADEKYYDPAGGYWRGAVWAPTTTMVIRGLDSYGFDGLAREIALNHLDIMGRVFKETGTIWENYAPDAAAPGKPAGKDFVGWSGLGPILYLLEYAIGLKPNAPENELTWNLRSNVRQGCERFRFAGHVVSLLAEAAPLDAKHLRVTVKSDGAFKLRLVRDGRTQIVSVKAGEQAIADSEKGWQEIKLPLSGIPWKGIKATLGGNASSFVAGGIWSDDARLVPNCNSVLFSGLTPDAGKRITGTFRNRPGRSDGAFNGLQIMEASR
jgi:hypothetical protein